MTMVRLCGLVPTLTMMFCFFASESVATITNFIEVDGFRYATLGNAEVNGTGYMGCEDSFLDMPTGWELVPWSNVEKVLDVVCQSTFDTTGVVLENGGYLMCRSMVYNDDCIWRHGIDEHANKLVQQGTKNRVRSCQEFCASFRVLIRQKAEQPTTKPTKKAVIASNSLRATFGWSTAGMMFMFWASAP